MKNTTRDLHQKAEKLRESDKLLDALKLYEEVILKYQKEANYFSLTEALGGRCLTYKHLFLLSDDYVFFNLALHSALSSLEIALKLNITPKIHRCYFRLGEMEMLRKKYLPAEKYYLKAFENYPKEEAEKGDFQYHLGEAQYRAGKIQIGLKNLLDGQELIKKFQSTTDSFVYNVWLSGSYKVLAELTKDKKYLLEAQKIIDSDPRLIIRRRQLSELSKNF
jgi:tetratricopeptide (TPR) repeat protein